MTIGEFCNREVVIVGPEASVCEAARLMREFHVGDLVVVEESGGVRRPVGIVTDRDIVVEVVADDVACESVTVGDVMASDLLTADEGDALLDTLHRMRERGVRRLPVLGERGTLVGILAVDDLVDLLAEQLADIVALVGREVHRERARRSD